MKKYRFLSVLCMAMAVVCLLLLADPTEAAAATVVTSGTCGDNLTWSLDDEGTLTISGTGEMSGWGYTEGWDENSVKKLVINTGVTVVSGMPTFPNLTSVSMPEGVEKIGSSAFSGCVNLSSVDIPHSVTSIGNYAFDGCTRLTSVTLGNNVVNIGNGAFYNCTGLMTIEIPGNVTNIGSSAFRGCTNLTSVVLNEGLEIINGGAFYGCTKLSTIVIPNTVESLGHTVFCGCTGLTSVTIGSGVTIIEDRAFDGCTNLGAIVIPDCVKQINNEAFYNCKSLKTVNMGTGVEVIEDGAFYNCESLTAVYITDLKAWCEIQFLESYQTTNPLYYAGKLYLNNELVTDLVIPDTITQIQHNAFCGGTSLTAVTIPDGVVSIGNSAFAGCSALTSVHIPDSVTTVYENAFINCEMLTNVYITDIKAWCEIEFLNNFSSCANPLRYAQNLYLNNQLVTNLVIPDGTTKISSNAFSKCTSIKSVTVPGSVVSIGESAFLNCSELTSVVIHSGVESIGSSAFSGCSGITSVYIPDSITYVDESAFYECTGLTGVYITNLDKWSSIEFGVDYANPLYYAKKLYLNNKLVTEAVFAKDSTIIGTHFSGCTDITSVIIPEGATSISANAFSGCTELTKVVIPKSITQIGYSAFDSCTKLTEVYITDLGAWCNIAFDGQYTSNPLCYGGKLYINGKLATDVVIPNGVNVIGAYAFYGCTSITSVTISDSVTSIGYSAFYNCNGLKSVIIGEGVTKLGNSAFNSCTNIEEIYFNAVNAEDLGSSNYVFSRAGSTGSGIKAVIGAKVTRIPAYLFVSTSYSASSTASLISVEFEKGSVCKSIGECAFGHISDLTTIELPEGVASIGKNAFYYCSNLSEIIIPDTVTHVGAQAFTNTAWYNAQPYGMVYFGLVAYKYKGTCPSNFAIKDGTKVIAEEAFYSATELKNITIPQSIQHVGDGAFYNCSKLIGVYIRSIGDWCAIEFADKDSNPLFYAKKLYLDNNLVTELNIPDGVKQVKQFVFYNCDSIQSVVIGKETTYIGQSAFYNCTGMTSLVIGDDVDTVEGGAFYNCTNLTEAKIGNGIRKVAKTAFRNWYSLTNLTYNAINMSDSVDDYGYNSNVFAGAGENGSGITLIVGNEVTRIPAYLFGGDGSISAKITSIIFEDGAVCNEIGASAFYSCTNLTKITIPKTIVSIGSNAFYNCSNVTEIRFDATNMADLTYSEKPFYNVGKNGTGVHVVVGANVTKIPNYLFYTLSTTPAVNPKIVSVEFEKGSVCKSIGLVAFGECKELTSVMIPDSVTQIYSSAFSRCTGLKEIYFTGAAPSINKTAFSNVIATAYYPGNDSTWTEDVRQNYGGTITWIPYNGIFELSSKEYMSFEEAFNACGEGQYLILKTNGSVNVTLTKDLYIDLNGFDLSGTVVTNGYKIYGMDSTTDNYTCGNIGYMNLVDENGGAIAPETHFSSNITGTSKRYMAIKTDDGYSFHRFYLGLTHMSLKPTVTGVGYKAVFYGDQMVAAALNSFGFTMQVEGYDPITVYMSGDKFVSGKTITLRIQNYDVENFGEAVLSAKVMLQLSDGTVIESTAASMTLRGLMEQLNKNYAALTQAQLSAVAEMIARCPVMKSWEISDLIKSDDGYVEISPN